MKVIKTAKYMGIVKKARNNYGVAELQIPADYDESEPFVRVEYNLDFEKEERETYDSPGSPAHINVMIRKIVATNDTKYGPTGTDITEAIRKNHQDVIDHWENEIREDEERKHERYGYDHADDGRDYEPWGRE